MPRRNSSAPAAEMTFGQQGNIQLTTNRWLFAFFVTAALEAFPHHHEDVGKDDKGEGDGQAAAVFLDQEKTLELPHLVIVLLH